MHQTTIDNGQVSPTATCYVASGKPDTVTQCSMEVHSGRAPQRQARAQSRFAFSLVANNNDKHATRAVFNHLHKPCVP